MCEYMQSECVRVKQGKVFFLNILREFFKENILPENEMLKITFLQTIHVQTIKTLPLVKKVGLLNF